MSARYELVQLPHGTFSIRSLDDRETFHPVAGPVAEAEALYVRQLRLRQRCDAISLNHRHPGPIAARDKFVIWDVGLGAGGNVLTAIRQLQSKNAQLHLVSFDRTAEALKCALAWTRELEFPVGFESQITTLLATNSVEFTCGSLQVTWDLHIGDFPSRVNAASQNQELPSPHAIFFDAFSPARNPAMWTLPVFENLFRCLDPRRPCAMATFSRSTAARVTMLLGGFFVGVGEPVAGKEETTIAANTTELIERPLDSKWLERARISGNAEPLREPVYAQQPLSPQTWEKLRRHPQFA